MAAAATLFPLFDHMEQHMAPEARVDFASRYQEGNGSCCLFDLTF